MRLPLGSSLSNFNLSQGPFFQILGEQTRL